MNKDLLIKRRTESSALDESVRAQVAQLSRLDQQRVIKTVIKYGNERIELDLSEKILKLGLDLHYRQVTVAMQEDGRLVMPVGCNAPNCFVGVASKDFVGKRVFGQTLSWFADREAAELRLGCSVLR